LFAKCMIVYNTESFTWEGSERESNDMNSIDQCRYWGK
jgi:hypothetical protein